MQRGVSFLINSYCWLSHLCVCVLIANLKQMVSLIEWKIASLEFLMVVEQGGASPVARTRPSPGAEQVYRENARPRADWDGSWPLRDGYARPQ